MKFLRFTSCLIVVLFNYLHISKAQTTIDGLIYYGQIHQETGLLFIRTSDAFYSIDGYTDQHVEIDMGIMEYDSIFQPPNTPYLFVYSPELNIIDLVENKLVFNQSKSDFDKIFQIDLVGELDAFFLVASEKSEKSELLKAKTISFYLIDILTGNTIWKYTPDEDQGELFSANTNKPIVLAKDRVIFPFGGNLFCLDSQLGSFLWKEPFHEQNRLKTMALKYLDLPKINSLAKQSSEYFKNKEDLIIFENYKIKKERKKSIRAVDLDGTLKWKLDLEKQERIGDIWNNLIEVRTSHSVKMIDLETGLEAWENPIISSAKYYSYKILQNKNVLLTKERPKIAGYPRVHKAFNLSTGEPLWKEPMEFPDKQKRVRFEEVGLKVFDKISKELAYFNYETGELIWSYPKDQLNNFKFFNNFYYISKENELDKLNIHGEKIWHISPKIKSISVWKVIPEGTREIIISTKNFSTKTISVISENGKILKSRDWNYSGYDSLLSIKYSQNKIDYVKFSGIYELNMSDTSQAKTITKFSGSTKQFIFNNDKSKLVVRTDDIYHFYDFNTCEYKMLSDSLKFKGGDLRRAIRFIGDDGVSIQNKENIAYIDFEKGLIFNKYFKYPEANLEQKSLGFGGKLLRGAVIGSANLLMLDQSVKSAQEQENYRFSGDEQFDKKAQNYNRNIELTYAVGSLLVAKIDQLEEKQTMRKQLASRAYRINIFSEKRKVDNQSTIVIVHVDPVTGEELNVFDIGEKNPVYYVDQLGGIIFYINKENVIKRFRI